MRSEEILSEHKQKINLENKFVIIFPVKDCDCNNFLLEAIKKNINKTNFIFIITDFGNKNINNHFTNDIQSHPNVLIDDIGKSIVITNLGA